jgi:ribosomal protein S18 acetylase RimI-like enzyme
MEYQIRPYKNSDKSTLEGLFNRFQDYLVSIDRFDILQRQADYGKRYINITLKTVLKGDGVIYVALFKGEIIGLIAALVYRSVDPGARPERRGRISELYVEMAYRNGGIGLALMKRAERYLMAKGCKSIFIDVFVPNSSAYGFYKKLGYTACDWDMIKKV